MENITSFDCRKGPDTTLFEHGSCRKALYRAYLDRHNINAIVGKSIFVLYRFHEDNMIERGVCTMIAASSDKAELVALCKKLYGEDVAFDANGRSQTIDTYMDKATFSIKTIALV